MAIETADDLMNFIRERTEHAWEAHKKPYFLAAIAVELAKSDLDYKPVIAPLRLQQWALSAKIPGIKVVAHPRHKAKVGFIPVKEEYNIESGDSTRLSLPKISRTRIHNAQTSSESIVLDFLRLLGNLDRAQIDSVNLPISVLTQMIKH